MEMEIIPSPASPLPPPFSSTERFKLFDQLELQEYHNKYVIKSVQSPTRGFSISRLDGNIQLLNDNDANDDNNGGSSCKTSIIYGVAGTIRLLAGTYMLVITSRKEVGEFLGFTVYKVVSMKFLPCNESLRFSTPQEKRDEAYFMNLLKVVESTPGLYFSYETDITLNLQRRSKLAEGWMTRPIWKSADPRFVWNRNLLDELIEFKLDEFIIPLLQGSFGATQLKLKDSPATLTLISRRCTRRLGTRMWRRGANLEGDTANFVETEQLLELEGYKYSLLQIRGSIPLLWEQIVDLSYKPRLRIISHEQMSKVVERHFNDLCQRYGDTIAVDLTNKHGDEGYLSSAYAAEMQKLPKVRYVSFDFHHFCGNSNFDNLQILNDQISDEFQKQGYFLIDTDGNILEEQEGIIRTNCIDCLDRTNVTQSFLAQKSLTVQLQRIGVLSSTDCFSAFSEEYGKFRTLWAEQGDEISLEYAGTHALKGDMVRYGRQTIGGLIKDGMSTLSRYYLNNFQDGVRQDALDLVSGHYSVNRDGPSPFQLNGFESLLKLDDFSCCPSECISGSGASSPHNLASCFGDAKRMFESAKIFSSNSSDCKTVSFKSTKADKLSRFSPKNMQINSHLLTLLHQFVCLGLFICIIPEKFSYGQNGILQYLPVASALLIGGLTITSVTIQQAGRNAQQYLSTVICAGVTAGLVAIVKANGRQFCSRPRLCGLI